MRQVTKVGRPRVRAMRQNDVPAAVALAARAFPGMPAWSERQLRRHLEVFPYGQLVAEDDGGRLLGTASALVVRWDDYDELAPWRVITGDGYFSTHDAAGFTLYGADIGVDPAARRRGVGQCLYDARKALARRLGLRRIIAGERIPGYAEVADRLTPADYVAEVVAGKRHDPVLSFQLANGFQVRRVIPGYLGSDKDSLGHATLLVWRNPELDAAAPKQA
ncbi:MAG TPA: GNAT family N-acetyltransferase [Oscillatoriaceae cyanobacterium]